MKRRELLLLTYHFPPSAASGTFRMLGFVRHLPRFGWDVRVIAPPEMPWDPVDSALAAQIPPQTIHDAIPYPRRAPRVLRWMAPYGIWLPFAWRACRRAIAQARPELVLTSGPPHVIHLLGLWLHRIEHLPWIADFRDPWISGMARSRMTLSQRWLRHAEKQVFARADHVIANAPNARQLYCSAYPRHASKIVTITNGFDPPQLASPTPPAGAPPHGIFRMLHAGEIYAGRDPLPLLDAMAALKTTGMASQFEVLGHVHLPKGDLGAEAAQRGLQADVVVRGQLPYQETLQEMAQTDLLVLLDGPGRTIGVPAKLYEYFGAGRPILALAEPAGDTARVLKESGIRHRIAPPRDVSRIRQAIADLAAEPPAIPDPERLRRFSREHLAGELARVMEEVVNKASVGA